MRVSKFSVELENEVEELTQARISVSNMDFNQLTTVRVGNLLFITANLNKRETDLPAWTNIAYVRVPGYTTINNILHSGNIWLHADKSDDKEYITIGLNQVMSVGQHLYTGIFALQKI